MNRRIFDDNYFFDRLLVRPLAELYRATIPPGFRDRLGDVIGNMKEPVVLANDLLQGDFGKAGVTAERFGINTTLGLGGMWDVAGDWDLLPQTGDFGQTLAVWGVGEGPYLMLPLLGPSDLRDALGRGVDIAMSPWQYIAWLDGGTGTLIRYEASYFAADALVRREHKIETFDALRAESIDPYVRMRSAWRQYRREQTGVHVDEEGP
jgi:phospholipid-binding lipoprotein MlaA